MHVFRPNLRKNQQILPIEKREIKIKSDFRLKDKEAQKRYTDMDLYSLRTRYCLRQILVRKVRTKTIK